MYPQTVQYVFHRMLTTEFLNFIGYEYPEDRKRDDNPLWLLGIPPFAAETHLYIQHQFMVLARESDWTEEDKYIWLHTYIYGESSERVAEDVVCTPHHVRERFQVCQDKLPGLVRAWWTERLADNPEVRLPELFDEFIVWFCENLEEDEQRSLMQFSVLDIAQYDMFGNR